jgi:hypothetical protein
MNAHSFGKNLSQRNHVFLQCGLSYTPAPKKYLNNIIDDVESVWW